MEGDEVRTADVSGLCHLSQAPCDAEYQIVRKDNPEFIIGNMILGAQHGMTKTERLSLIDHDDLAIRSRAGNVDVGFYAWLFCTADEDEFLRSGLDGLLNGELEERFFDDGQQLLCCAEGRGAKPCALACDWENNGFERLCILHRKNPF